MRDIVALVDPDEESAWRGALPTAATLSASNPAQIVRHAPCSVCAVRG